jgi:hypothetical protein
MKQYTYRTCWGLITVDLREGAPDGKPGYELVRDMLQQASTSLDHIISDIDRFTRKHYDALPPTKMDNKL